MGLGGMRAPMTSAKPLAGQAPAPAVRTVRQPIGQAGLPQPVRSVRQPISPPALVPQEEVALEELEEETPLQVVEEEVDTSDAVEEVQADVGELTEAVEERLLETEDGGLDPAEVTEATPPVMEETVGGESTTMSRPTTLLKPIRGVLRPLDEEEEVRTASLTPVGHMLVPEKKRGPPPSASIGAPKTAKLRPVKGTLKPVTKEPSPRLEPESGDEQED